MSQRNLEITRQIYSEWALGKFDAGTKHYDERTALVMRPEFPDAGTYTGPEQIRTYMLDFLGAWEHLVIEAESFLEAGENVVVGVKQRSKGKGSGVPVELRYFQVWSFRGDAVERIESIKERSDALEAAGLPEAGS